MNNLIFVLVLPSVFLCFITSQVAVDMYQSPHSINSENLDPLENCCNYPKIKQCGLINHRVKPSEDNVMIVSFWTGRFGQTM